MAAYAALITLSNILEDINSHPNPSFTSLDKQPIESLQNHVSFFVDFLESLHNQTIRTQEIEDLEIRMRDSAHAAEDLIETHIVDQIQKQGRRKGWVPKRFGKAGYSGIVPAPLFLKDPGSAFVSEGSTSHEIPLIDTHKVFEEIQKSFVKKQRLSLATQDIHKVTQEMEEIRDEVVKMIRRKGFKYEQQQQQIPTRGTPMGKNKMVGFDDKLNEILDVLTGNQSSRQTISITGMGGMGKTTIARNAYEHPLIVQHFDFRAWVVVSQEFTGREILSGILGGDNQNSYEELGEQLHKKLSYRRYLVVMDDIWNVEAWEKVRRFLPDNNNGSRIMITTRLSMLANDVSSCRPYKMDFLDEDKSWSLLQEKVFGGEYCCPPELEDIGKKIARDCQGVPLAITVIAGLLQKSNGVQSFWEHVAEDVKMVVHSQNNQHCMKILSLSYNHLPVHLKPCFLYMGVFPEDKEIRVSKIVKLWACEGFLKPVKNKSSEEVAEEHLNDLIDRNLIMVRELGSRGNTKSCHIHDLLRELCIIEAEKENFLGVTRVFNEDPPVGIKSRRRLSLHACGKWSPHVGGKWGLGFHPQVVDALKTATLTRSVVCDSEVGSREAALPQITADLRLLRVLDVTIDYSEEQILQHVNARYLSLSVDWEKMHSRLPPAISFLWNLQTLIIFDSSFRPILLPIEIWSMTKLKHLQSGEVVLPDPQGQNSLILKNLQSLSTVKNFMCQKDILQRVPNIKKLKLNYSYIAYCRDPVLDLSCLTSLFYLEKLESLTLCNVMLDKHGLALPDSLKKLSLSESHLCLENMRVVDSLPNLEVLKINRPQPFDALLWDPVEGDFLCLKFLQIAYVRSWHWGEDAIHFPRLEKLVLIGIDTLEIPSGIGDIPTLQLIKLEGCGGLTVASATRISEEQRDMGNESLQIQVISKPW